MNMHPKTEAPGVAAGCDSGDEKRRGADSAKIPPEAAPGEGKALLEMARTYLSRGLVPIRLKAGEKIPPGKHDANTLSQENAAQLLSRGLHNIGLRLGADGGGLVDFDLDWPEARRVGAKLLFAFPKFGRSGAPGSHYLIRCPGFDRGVKFDIPELKGIGGLPDERAPRKPTAKTLSGSATLPSLK